MDSYTALIGKTNQIKFKETTSLPEGVARYENDWNLEWRNPLAIQRVYETTMLLGRAPDMLSRKAGQSAVWFNPESKVEEGSYYKFEIYDVAYVHNQPATHTDFFFVTMRMQLKPKTIESLNKISGSISYYAVGNLLTATCHFIGASIASFAIVKQVDNCEINVSQARQLYGIYIKELHQEFIASEKCGDLKNFETPMRNALESYIMADLPDESAYTIPEGMRGFPGEEVAGGCGCGGVGVGGVGGVDVGGVGGVGGVGRGVESEVVVIVVEEEEEEEEVIEVKEEVIPVVEFSSINISVSKPVVDDDVSEIRPLKIREIEDISPIQFQSPSLFKPIARENIEDNIADDIRGDISSAKVSSPNTIETFYPMRPGTLPDVSIDLSESMKRLLSVETASSVAPKSILNPPNPNFPNLPNPPKLPLLSSSVLSSPSRNSQEWKLTTGLPPMSPTNNSPVQQLPPIGGRFSGMSSSNDVPISALGSGTRVDLSKGINM